jgi:hypothetical protein
MGASALGLIAPPISGVVFGLGYAVRKIGNRLVDSANTLNPTPCLTKVV